MRKVPTMVYGIMIGLLTGGVFWFATTKPRGIPLTLLPTSTAGVLTIYVSGSVLNPGVYILPAGSRMNEAIQAAGGFIAEAESESINLASQLEDGQQVDVPGIIDTGHINAGRVDINNASVSELDALPGIGPTTAQSIVDYRLENGPFRSTQDLLNVPGVGPATYDRIKDYITVEQ